MQTIHDKFEGDVFVSEDTTLHGMIVGNVTVQNGVVFDLHGMLIGDLIAKMKSCIYIRGTLNGDIYNHEGSIDIYGIVNGAIIYDSGNITIDPKAVIKGKSK